MRNGRSGFKFRRQHPIGPYIADFYCRKAALVVEVDGAVAHSSKEAVAHNQAGDEFMQSLGLMVRPTGDTTKNHISNVVLDAPAWEHRMVSWLEHMTEGIA